MIRCVLRFSREASATCEGDNCQSDQFDSTSTLCQNSHYLDDDTWKYHYIFCINRNVSQFIHQDHTVSAAVIDVVAPGWSEEAAPRCRQEARASKRRGSTQRDAVVDSWDSGCRCRADTWHYHHCADTSIHRLSLPTSAQNFPSTSSSVSRL